MCDPSNQVTGLLSDASPQTAVFHEMKLQSLGPHASSYPQVSSVQYLCLANAKEPSVGLVSVVRQGTDKILMKVRPEHHNIAQGRMAALLLAKYHYS
jgi:hypothetical protein